MQQRLFDLEEQRAPAAALAAAQPQLPQAAARCEQRDVLDQFVLALAARAAPCERACLDDGRRCS